MEEEITITEPTRFAQFSTLEAYNAVNVAIAQYKDALTNGEYTRTETACEYNPEPEPAWDGNFYMEARPELVEAGLFEGVTILDSVQKPTDSNTKLQIQAYLIANGIEFSLSWTKAQLLAAI